MARANTMAAGLALALTAGALAQAGEEPASARPAYFGLAFHGAYVARDDDGTLDCNPYGQALRLSFRGRITGETDGFEEVEDAEIRVILPGEWRHRERLRYGLSSSWYAFGDDPDEETSHEALINRWVCAGLGCRTRGTGEVRIRLEPDGDIHVLDFHWRERFETPLIVHAGGEAGPARMGHCPALG
ncbi:MAG: hypothetical protein JJU18_09960 [Oceanicaulis sp.]|nr:hypothetical protein [Oceanicaulis sp.]